METVFISLGDKAHPVKEKTTKIKINFTKNSSFIEIFILTPIVDRVLTTLKAVGVFKRRCV